MSHYLLEFRQEKVWYVESIEGRIMSQFNYIIILLVDLYLVKYVYRCLWMSSIMFSIVCLE